jgi:hypothetical protein
MRLNFYKKIWYIVTHSRTLTWAQSVTYMLLSNTSKCLLTKLSCLFWKGKNVVAIHGQIFNERSKLVCFTVAHVMFLSILPASKVRSSQFTSLQLHVPGIFLGG